MKKVNRRFDLALLGTSLSGLISVAYMAKHGAKVVVVEKNQHIGGRAMPFWYKKDNKKIFFEREFHGFSANGNYFETLLWDELELSKDTFFDSFKNKMQIIDQKDVWNIPNESNYVINRLYHDHPLSKDELVRFFELILRCDSESIYFKSALSGYKNAQDFLLDFFGEDTVVFKLFANLAFFGGLSLKELDSSAFVKIIINHFTTKIVFPNDGMPGFCRSLVKIIKKADGEIVNNTKVDKGLLSGEIAKAFRICYDKYSQNISPKKFLIGMDINTFNHDVMNFKGPYFKKYVKTIKELKSKYTKIIFHCQIKSPLKSITFFKTLLNEHGFDFNTNNLKGNIETDPILIINFQALENYRSKSKNTINIEFLDSHKNWVEVFTNFSQSKMEEYLADLKNKLITRLKKQFGKEIEDNLDFVTESTPHIYAEEFFTHDINPYNGLILNYENGLDQKTLLTPLVNCYIASRYGNPGGDLSNVFENAYNVYHSFDIKYKGFKSTQIDTLSPDELMSLLQSRYKFSVKYKNKTIGIHLDHEISYLLTFGQEKLLIKRSTFDEAFSSDLYIFCNTSILKNLIQKRAVLTKEVLTNNIRIKGGVWLFKRMMTRSNIYYFDEKSLNEYNQIKNHHRITYTSALASEIRQGASGKQSIADSKL